MFDEKDFLKVEFSVRGKDGALIDSTDAEEARKAGIYDENKRYGESLVMLQDPRFIQGFKNALLNAEIGKKLQANLKPAEAFGERDESLVKLLPLQKFREQGIDPVPGLQVALDDFRGRVQSVSGGRVRVDLNHELAGREVSYEFTVKKRITEAAEKAGALADEVFQGGLTVTLKDGVAETRAGMPALSKKGYGDRKVLLLQNAMLYIPEITKFVWTEEFERT
ncbi:MAG: peptidylprolyl isomerase [Candidatus Micrarchaeota archaeon]